MKKKTALKSRPKPKKQPKPTLTKLKKKADKLFSMATRYRDAEMIAEHWTTRCFTCGKIYPFNKIHAGHFMSRRYLATRWDERNVHPQCAGCNTFNGGEQYRYGVLIDEWYGDGTAKELYDLAHSEFKLTRDYLEEIINDSKEQIAFYEKDQHQA